jgi:predicted flap endonuclease-1-like 5' DNA nuclease
MSENKKTGIGAWGIGLFSFLAGLFIGLVVLGWWLWPVQWTNATYEILIPEQQEDFLRASIDSYTLEPDAALANQRFEGLGPFGPSTLGAIAADPGAQSAAEIDGFASAVGATDVIQNPPERPTDATTAELAVGRAIASPATAGLCVLVLLLLAALVILFILRRRGKKMSAIETSAPAPASTVVTPDEAILPAEPVEDIAEPLDQTTAEQGEALPDWLQEAPPAEGEPLEMADTGVEPTQEESPEGFGSPEVEEKSLSDEDIAEITSSQFSPSEEGQEVPDFMKDVSAGEATGAILAAGAGLAAVTALTGEDEGEGEPDLTEGVEELPPTEDVTDTQAGLVAAEMVEETGAEETPVAEMESKETQAEAHAKFGQDIESVTGIGPTYGEKLRLAGITSPLLLLRNGASAKGRQKIAEDTGISERLILKWVNFVDLYRIKGVSEAYAELLEAAGVDTVPELANRNPTNLHARLLEVIQEKRVYRTPPELSEVESWVAQAKKLPRAIHY